MAAARKSATSRPPRSRFHRFAPVLTALLEDLWDNANRDPRRRTKSSAAGKLQVLRLAREDLRHVRALFNALDRQVFLHNTDRPCDCGVCRAYWTHVVEPQRRREGR